MTLAEVYNIYYILYIYIYYILYMNKFTYWLQNLALKIDPGRKNLFIGPSTYIWLKIEYRRAIYVFLWKIVTFFVTVIVTPHFCDPAPALFKRLRRFWHFFRRSLAFPAIASSWGDIHRYSSSITWSMDPVPDGMIIAQGDLTMH